MANTLPPLVVLLDPTASLEAGEGTSNLQGPTAVCWVFMLTTLGEKFAQQAPNSTFHPTAGNVGSSGIRRLRSFLAFFAH